MIEPKQGFGRLIRSKTNTSIVAILDPCAVTIHYGNVFLDSLPDSQRVFDVTSTETLELTRHARNEQKDQT